MLPPPGHMLRVYLIHPKRGLIQCHRISFDVIRCQLSQAGTRLRVVMASTEVPVAAGLRSGGGVLEGRCGAHAAEDGPVGTPHVAVPLGRRTMMAAACGFPRFALDFSPRGRLALCRGGRRGPGGWYPPRVCRRAVNN
jgi:hypothetical protein